MIRQALMGLAVIALGLAMSAQAEAQEQPPAADTATPTAAEPLPAASSSLNDTTSPAALAPTSSTLPATTSLAAPAPCATTCPTSESSIDHDDHSTGWLIIGIGGSMGASSVALGASLMAQGGTNAENRLGSATLTAGLTGVAVSLIVGLLAM